MKNKISIVLIITLLFTIVACAKVKYTVTFDSNGGSSIESITIEKGNKVPEPTKEPIFEGNNFEGWFIGEEKFKFNETIIEGDITLIAKWSKIQEYYPVFIDEVNGRLPDLIHLKSEDIDLLEDVSVEVEKGNATVQVSYLGSYDPNTPGDYEITYEAESDQGLKTTIKRTVIVKDANVKIYHALVINGNSIDYSHNQSDALQYTSSGTKFRTSDLIQVMDKEFFVNQYNQYKDSHTNNAKIPFFPNGVILIVDEELKVKHIRIAAGALIEINEDGEIVDGTLEWTNSVSQSNGGGLFKGLIDRIDDIIPSGGHVMFVGNTTPEKSRQFFIKNLFYSEYQSGAITKADFNVDLSELEIEFKEVKEINPLPEPLNAPQTKIIYEHVFTWGPVLNAIEYEIYIDNKLVDTTDRLSVLLTDYNLNITGNDDKFELEVVAVSSDSEKWLNSNKSPVKYYTPKSFETTEVEVVFETQGGSTIDSINVRTPGLIRAPEFPENEGFFFDGWYTNITYSEKWDFENNYINNDITLYAKWKPIEIDYNDTFKVLAIGNSFSSDAHRYLWSIAESYGIKGENIVIGNMYIAGGRLDQHLNNLNTNNAIYTYQKFTGPNITQISSSRLSDVIKAEDWDFITFQQASHFSGVASEYKNYVNTLTNWAKQEATNKDVVIGWHMTWAYEQSSTHAGFANYNNSQETMFEMIIETLHDKVFSNGNINLIIPAGVAVQNARTSYVGDNLTADGYHLSDPFGRYIAALSYFKALTNFETTPETISFAPNGLSDEDILVAFESVNNAFENKYKVTNSIYTEEKQAEKVISINDNEFEFNYNWDNALEYTTSGTRFRLFDEIQVMDKDFFINSYNDLKADHTNNNGIPFLTNGVILILDKDFKLKQARIAAVVYVQINSDGTIESENLSWNNAIDKDLGGGMFKGLVEDLDDLIPNDGYIVFVGARAPAEGRKYLINNLYDNTYVSGAIKLDSNIDVTNVEIEIRGLN